MTEQEKVAIPVAIDESRSVEPKLDKKLDKIADKAAKKAGNALKAYDREHPIFTK